MSKVSINPPKTPVTEGSNGTAMATVPNVCKMPGPPAPFVPAPLPNIGKSGMSPKGYSKTVTIEGKKVAIKGATFNSMGDIASKGTGGGLISANCEGITSFVGPGSMDVKIEGKNVQLLGDPMLNNCGPSGSPPNAATMFGVVQDATVTAIAGDELCPLCEKAHGDAARLAESPATKGASDQLRDAADRAVAAARVQQAADVASGVILVDRGKTLKTIKMTSMLGVAICDQGKTYAAKSMQAFTEFAEAVPAGWHTPAPICSMVGRPVQPGIPPMSRFQKFAKDKAQFAGVWRAKLKDHMAWSARVAEREKLRQQGLLDPNDPEPEPFYNPGQCAGQQVILIALEHNARPVAMTERWYKTGDPAAQVFVFYRPDIESKPRGGAFGGDHAIPPCGSCRAIVLMLLCPDHERPTTWSSPTEEGVCRCRPKKRS